MHDFKIAAEIIPYVFARFDNGDLKGGMTCEFEHGIYEALDYEWNNDEYLSFPVNDKITDSLYFSRELNWNIECLE